MAGLTQRNGMWYATWKQNGITTKRATGFPVGSTREEQRKNKEAAHFELLLFLFDFRSTPFPPGKRQQIQR